MADIKDFGEKIGGARKDVWAARGLIRTDLAEMTDLERQNHVKKDNIWIRPNWEQLISDGVPQSVAYWQNKMRQAIPPKPPANTEEVQSNYVEVVGRLRDAIMAVKEPREIDNFYQNYLRPNFVDSQSRGYYVTIIPEANGIVNNKVLKAAQSKSYRMADEAKKKLFGVPKDEKTYTAVKNMLSIYKYDGDRVSIAPDAYSKDKLRLSVKSSYGTSFYYLSPKDKFYNVDEWEKDTYFVVNDNSHKPLMINFSTLDEAQKFVESFSRDAQALADKRDNEQPKENSSNRKKAFVPPQLQHIHRTGPQYRGIRSIDGDVFLNELKFRAGEFGNWLNDNDRQASLNMAYEAFRDLARVLHIAPEDVALNNNLAIAFGARGRGGAGAGAAHYEPDRQVINLTKMSGAGCLAHEWGHALDHAIGRSCGGIGLASEMKAKRDLPDSFKDLMTSFKYKTVVVQSDEVISEQKDRVDNCRKNLAGWIASVKPKKFPEGYEQKWNEVSETILNSSSSITGVEYMSFGRSKEVVTNPEVEMLSQIRKLCTNHIIPKDAKQQIVIWASSLKSAEEQLKSQEPIERRVKTDFFKGSAEFDKVFSKAGHGYWQSDCEMFARAFDCYVADKIKETGDKSEYLTAYANSFKMPGTNGEMISAVPMGEERKVINEKFDLLITDLKERGLVKDFIEDLEATKPKENSSPTRLLKAMEEQESTDPALYKQISFEDLLAEEEPAKDERSRPQNTIFDFER